MFECASTHCQQNIHKHTQDSSQRVRAERSRWPRSSKKECYREAHLNTQTVAFHLLCYNCTKYSPATQHSLRDFTCTMWFQCHYSMWCTDPVWCLRSTKTTWKDLVLHFKLNKGFRGPLFEPCVLCQLKPCWSSSLRTFTTTSPSATSTSSPSLY